MRGSCLCGDISFEVQGPIEGPSICHCGQCRKLSGHVWASAFVPNAQLTITGPVRWYQSSAAAKRGFCPRCGAFLFWKALEEGTTSFALGALDEETGITLEKHIFTSDKGDYYQIADGLPQT